MKPSPPPRYSRALRRGLKPGPLATWHSEVEPPNWARVALGTALAFIFLIVVLAVIGGR